MKRQNTLLLIIALPLIGALYLAAAGISNRGSAANEAALTELGRNASELRHAIEKEKEASSLFLDSKGKRSATELLSQWEKTNKRITAFKGFILKEFGIGHNSHSYGTKFKQRLSLAMDKLGNLEACRSSVSSLSLTATEANDYYNDLITSLADIDKGGKNNDN